MKPPYTPPWIFGLTNLPFGVAGTYAGVAMPFLLRKAGVSVDKIAVLEAIAFLPAAYQLFWAPVLDLAIRRRTWLVLCATSGSLCLGATLLLKLPDQLLAYEILLVAGQALVGLVASCNGALVATTVDPGLLGRAAGWVNAANLGASVVGGGLVLTLATEVSSTAAAVALVLTISSPSLAALSIAEAPPAAEKLSRHLAQVAGQVWTAIRARRGWTGLVFCMSPVGTAALSNLFSALGRDFGASDGVVTWVNGYFGGLATAMGALAAGFILDRLSDRRNLFLASGACVAACAAGMAVAPLRQETFVVGCLLYLFAAGMAYASFSAMVYEVVGPAGSAAATLYSVFPAAGNQAIAYTLLLDGAAQHAWKTRGTLWTDAALNITGVIVLLFLARAVFPDRQTPQAAPSGANDESGTLEIGSAR